MPRKNRRLEEALARVDAAIAQTKKDGDVAAAHLVQLGDQHDAALKEVHRFTAMINAFYETRDFLTEGGKP
jgi:hypothetical protein